jgi:hypothetical protein
MAKKVFVLLVLAVVTVGSLFAQETTGTPEKKTLARSAGGGGFLGGDFGGGAKGTLGNDFRKTKTPYFGGGVFAFFDLVYAELSLGYFSGSGTGKETDSRMNSRSADFSLTNFNIGLLGKYPVAYNEKLYLFPLLGLEYDICLSAKQEDNEYDDPSDLSALWLKFGGGLDLAVSEKLYLRVEALYGIRLKNKFEEDLVDNYKSMAPGISAEALLGHGLTVKVAMGYKI